MTDYARMSQFVVEGNIEEIKKFTQQCLNAGSPANEILEKALLPGMDIVGQRFKAGALFIPEVLRSFSQDYARVNGNSSAFVIRD